MTPVEELRTAAALIREKAKFATGGPWTCSPVWSPDSGSTSGVYSMAHPTGTVASEVVASGRVKDGYGGIRQPHNAVWITLMQPAVAEPLAAWLERCASDLESAAAVASKWPDNETARHMRFCDEPDSVSHALTLARALNGSTR